MLSTQGSGEQVALGAPGRKVGRLEKVQAAVLVEEVGENIVELRLELGRRMRAAELRVLLQKVVDLRMCQRRSAAADRAPRVTSRAFPHHARHAQCSRHHSASTLRHEGRLEL